MLRITVWNEGIHERTDEEVRRIYPNGMGAQIAAYLQGRDGIGAVRVSELHHPEQGLSQRIVDETDVMTWWGHKAHREITDENLERVYRRVMDGMGLIVLHSGHHSRIY